MEKQKHKSAPGVGQGPLRISDFKVVLDKRVYRDLEGSWQDLFNRIKWDVVKSVAKSAVGFQKGKLKVAPSAALVRRAYDVAAPALLAGV